jgi:hypothetical protein
MFSLQFLFTAFLFGTTQLASSQQQQQQQQHQQGQMTNGDLLAHAVPLPPNIAYYWDSNAFICFNAMQKCYRASLKGGNFLLKDYFLLNDILSIGQIFKNN